MKSVLKPLASIFLISLFALSCGKKISETTIQSLSVTRDRRETSYSVTPGKVTIWKRGKGYDCAVFIPVDYSSNPSKTFPLIISLHGYNETVMNINHTNVGGTKGGFIKQVWDTPLANTFSGIVIAPHVYAVGTSENMLWDRNELRDLIIESIESFKVDPERIVATGISSGSIATQELLKYSGDLLAGGMPGHFQYLYPRDVCVYAQMPIWAFGKQSDERFDATGWQKLGKEIKKCSSFNQKFKLTLTQLNQWENPSVQRWLTEQVRKHNYSDEAE